MKTNNIKSIDIYFDSQNTCYYVRFTFSSYDELPSFYEMNKEQKTLLYSMFPELEAFGKHPGDETIEKDFDPKIEAYNERCRNSYRIKWKAYMDGVLEQINQKEMIQILEKKRKSGNFVSINYDKTPNDDVIIDFIENYKSDIKDQYMTYYCDECKQWRYGIIKNKKVKCKCGKSFSYDDYDNDKKLFKFSGANALNKAAAKAAEMAAENNSSQTSNPFIESKDRSFYYNGMTYQFTLGDFMALHEMLYQNCAIESVFQVNSGKITFQLDYENYLKGISKRENINSEWKSLYQKKSEILLKINEVYDNVNGAMLGFYLYFHYYIHTRSKALRWRIENTIYSFSSPEDYVVKLCAAFQSQNNALINTLISLYNDQTCQYFFQNYDSRKIELSRLIFEKTNGKYVYINENNKVIDFGTEFINRLSVVDDQITEKIEFIYAIQGDDAFWKLICGSYSDYDFYSSTSNDYYDLLCYYQFAIQGKSILNYRSLQIKNAIDGMEYIRTIVSNAYLRRNNITQQRYQDLLSLIFDTSLLDSVIFRNENIVKVGRRDSKQPLIDTLKSLLKSTESIPSINAYLFCLNLVDKNVKFYFDDRLDTLLGHAKYLMSMDDTRRNRIADYISSNEVKEVLKCIFAEGQYEKILDEGKAAFQKMKQALNEIQDVSHTSAKRR